MYKLILLAFIGKFFLPLTRSWPAVLYVSYLLKLPYIVSK